MLLYRGLTNDYVHGRRGAYPSEGSSAASVWLRRAYGSSRFLFFYSPSGSRRSDAYPWELSAKVFLRHLSPMHWRAIGEMRSSAFQLATDELGEPICSTYGALDAFDNGRGWGGPRPVGQVYLFLAGSAGPTAAHDPPYMPGITGDLEITPSRTPTTPSSTLRLESLWSSVPWYPESTLHSPPSSSRSQRMSVCGRSALRCAVPRDR